MNYLFVELHKNNKNILDSSICIIGYVLYNEKLEEIKKDLITLKSDLDFDEKVLNNLSIDKKVFDESKDFADMYNDLKNIFEQENQCVILKNAYLDAKMINTECERISKMPFIYDFYDFDEIVNAYNLVGKSFVKNDIEIPNVEFGNEYFNNLELMKNILEKMSLKFEMSFEDFLNLDKNAIGTINNKDGFIAFRKTRDVVNNENIFNSNRNHNSNYRCFKMFLDNYNPEIKGTLLENKTICISQNYESENFKQICNLIKLIKDNGGNYTVEPRNCDIFVTVEVKNVFGNFKNCKRLKVVESEKLNGKLIEVIDLISFLKMLDITKEQLDNLPIPNMDTILENKQVKRVYKKVIRNFNKV